VKVLSIPVVYLFVLDEHTGNLTMRIMGTECGL